jgi:hypothetical protein
MAALTDHVKGLPKYANGFRVECLRDLREPLNGRHGDTPLLASAKQARERETTCHPPVISLVARQCCASCF